MVPKARLKINFKNLQNTSEHYQQIVGFVLKYYQYNKYNLTKHLQRQIFLFTKTRGKCLKKKMSRVSIWA